MTILRLNGRRVTVSAAPMTPLVDVLRDEVGDTSPKTGCREGRCGSCTVLLDEKPDASRDEIKAGLVNNLCRCTGYTKILDAVETLTVRAQAGSRG